MRVCVPTHLARRMGYDIAMKRRGQRASLPGSGYEPPQRIRLTDTTCVVDFYEEEEGQAIPFDFGRFPVHRHLQEAMAQAFAQLTGPSGTQRSYISAERSYSELGRFSRFLATLEDQPTCAADITISHIDRYLLSRRKLSSSGSEYVQYTLDVHRQAMLAVKGLSEPVRARLLLSKLRTCREASHASSYTRGEVRRIVQAARNDLRAAAKRIRASQELLSQWRRGAINRDTEKQTWERGYLLDCLATSDDVPRLATERGTQAAIVKRSGGIRGLQHALHLSQFEVAAAVVLLIVLTGLNGGVLARLTIKQERADSGSDEPAITIIDAVKPRRGQRARFMSVPLVNIPSAASGQSEQSGQDHADTSRRAVDDLTTSKGVYSLLLELTAVARNVSGSRRLCLWCATGTGTPRVPRPFSIREGLPAFAVPAWGRSVGMTADAVDASGVPESLVVTQPRLRLTFVQRHQRPVAHASHTLANDYLIRDRGAVSEYQQVVAETQHDQVTRARQNLRLRVLPREALEQAARNLPATAHELGLSTSALAGILDRSLDTVLASCIDFMHSPFTEDGQPCDASFLMCLSCPCARATPEHLPLLLETCDQIEERRRDLTPAAWVRLYAGPHAQLTDVIRQFDPATIDAARSKITERGRDLVQRLLARALDVQ